MAYSIIILRDRCKKLLTHDQRNEVKNFCLRLDSLETSHAMDILWRLIYDRENMMTKIFTTYHEMSNRTIRVVCSEIRHQYFKTHHNIFASIPGSCRKSLQALCSRHMGSVIAFVVIKKYKAFICSMNSNLGKVLYLLGHTDSQKNYGGLKEFGFSHEEIYYLQKYASEIASLISDLYEANYWFVDNMSNDDFPFYMSDVNS